MQIKYDIPKLEQIINDIYVLTGLSINFLNLDFETLCSRTKENDFCSVLHEAEENDLNCQLADESLLKRSRTSRKFESHICHAGLYDAVTPVMKSGMVVGYVIMGRIRSSQSPTADRFDNNEKLKALYEKIPYFTDQKIASLQSLLQDILFENAIKFDYDQVIDEVAAYVEKELKSELSIEKICAGFCISKNYLYEGFRRYYGVTVNEYITNLRINKAKKLLTETKKPVYEICEEVGVDNYTYFCRLFKKRVGMSPGEFRKI